MKTEELAEQAFARMDTQLDLSIRVLTLTLPFPITVDDYAKEFPEIWTQVDPHTPTIIDGKSWFRTNSKLFCERLLAIPPSFTKNRSVLPQKFILSVVENGIVQNLQRNR
jgi:hypothetical protein